MERELCERIMNNILAFDGRRFFFIRLFGILDLVEVGFFVILFCCEEGRYNC